MRSEVSHSSSATEATVAEVADLGSPDECDTHNDH